MIELSAKILVRRSLRAKEEGKRLLEILAKHFPRHVPQRFGDSEPLKWRFESHNLESALQVWGNHGFLLQRRQPDLLVDVLFASPSPNPRHSTIGLLDFQADQPEDLRSIVAFICEVSEVFEADYAAAHILTVNELSQLIEIIGRRPHRDPDILRRRVEREGFAKVLWGLTIPVHTTLWLKKYLPDLLWLTVFGEPYIELFARDRILSAPASKVQILSTGAIVLQLTEGIEDSSSGWRNFESVRNRCKQHLNCNAFYDPAAPAGHTYSVPKFQFSSEMYRRERPRFRGSL